MDASRQNHFERKAFRYMSEHTHEKMLYLLSNLSFLNVRYTVFAYKKRCSIRYREYSFRLRQNCEFNHVINDLYHGLQSEHDLMICLNIRKCPPIYFLNETKFSESIFIKFIWIVFWG